jgi:hypothetical protein
MGAVALACRSRGAPITVTALITVVPGDNVVRDATDYTGSIAGGIPRRSGSAAVRGRSAFNRSTDDHRRQRLPRA